MALVQKKPPGIFYAYDELSQQAPSYAKSTLGSTATTVYEVDPREDLGALGTVVVPANGTVRGHRHFHRARRGRRPEREPRGDHAMITDAKTSAAATTC